MAKKKIYFPTSPGGYVQCEVEVTNGGRFDRQETVRTKTRLGHRITVKQTSVLVNDPSKYESVTSGSIDGSGKTWTSTDSSGGPYVWQEVRGETCLPHTGPRGTMEVEVVFTFHAPYDGGHTGSVEIDL